MPSTELELILSDLEHNAVSVLNKSGIHSYQCVFNYVRIITQRFGTGSVISSTVVADTVISFSSIV